MKRVQASGSRKPKEKKKKQTLFEVRIASQGKTPKQLSESSNSPSNHSFYKSFLLIDDRRNDDD